MSLVRNFWKNGVRGFLWVNCDGLNIRGIQRFRGMGISYSATRIEDFIGNSDVAEVVDSMLENSCPVMEEEGLEKKVEMMSSNVTGKKKDDNVVEKQIKGIESEVDDGKISIATSCKTEEKDSGFKGTSLDGSDEARIPIVHSCRAVDYKSLRSYSSMRKGKEWNRTLACKLLEDRHSADGGEGMDLLWEAYEIDSSKQKHEDTKMNKRKKKSALLVQLYEDEEDNVGQLCCLQTPEKLSAGKMSLGMLRPTKISKAIKGIGWLHHVSRKKVHISSSTTSNSGDKY